MRKKLLSILPIFIFAMIFFTNTPTYAGKYDREIIEYTLPEKYLCYENKEETSGFSSEYYNPSEIVNTVYIDINCKQSDEGYEVPNQENLEKMKQFLDESFSNDYSLTYNNDLSGKLVEINGVKGYYFTFTCYHDEIPYMYFVNIYLLVSDKTMCILTVLNPQQNLVYSEGKEIANSIKIRDTVLKSKGIPFTDVPTNSWYFNAVKYTYDNKIISGTNAYTFAPNYKLTRGMIVTILWRMEGSPANDGKSKFTDVASDKWYSQAIKWAAQNKIVNGYSGTTKFGPTDNILRQDLAGILRNYAKYKGKNINVAADLTKFYDYKNISNYAVDSMKWAVGTGVISGNGNGTLAPKGNATRAEAAAMIQKYCNKVGR